MNRKTTDSNAYLFIQHNPCSTIRKNEKKTFKFINLSIYGCKNGNFKNFFLFRWGK